MRLTHLLFLSVFCTTCLATIAQEEAVESVQSIRTDTLQEQKDLPDLLRALLKKQEPRKANTSSSLAVLPALGYNPSVGFLFGVNIAKSYSNGDPRLNKISVMQLDVSYTTEQLFIARFRHNVFRQENKWNLQGNWQFMKGYAIDYGLGDVARRDPPMAYPIRYNYFRFTEKVYRQIAPDLFAGLGTSIDIRSRINDERLDTGRATPHYRYNSQYGFDPAQYSVNGLMAIIQYNTRDHPNRAYKGMYADLNIRVNPKWLGSTSPSGQLYTELRKYIPLSHQNHDHTLALWYYGSYLLWGKLPYLELPGTGYDHYNRSGRGYTIGRFKGQDYFYAEAEYRFPITTDKLLSGVAFLNLQSASERGKTPLFKYIEPATGVGLRIHFNKFSRTYVCIDYAIGRYGSKGLFFALNEAF